MLSSVFSTPHHSMKINLGSIQIPLNAATKTFAILAKRGAGKSYTGAVMAEEFHKNNVPFVVFDPIGPTEGKLRCHPVGCWREVSIAVFPFRTGTYALK